MFKFMRFFQTIFILFTRTLPGTNIPIWNLVVAIIELIILGILIHFIISDLKVIRWFEKKKKEKIVISIYTGDSPKFPR